MITTIGSCSSPTDPKCVLTKRIIALEGDTVQPLKRGSKPGKLDDM